MGKIGRLFALLGEDRNRLVYTLLVFFNHFAFGVSINILGACLNDLAHIFDVSIDDASLFPAGLGVGYFVGALVGFLYRWLDRQIVLSVLVTFIAVIVAFLPLYGYLWVAIVFMFFMGIGSGAWDGSQTSWIVELWPLYPTTGLQTIQFLYGVGGIVAPLLASPFVYGDKNVTANNETITIDDRIHSLTIPFAINGVLQIIVPILLFVLYFIYPYRKPEAEIRTETPLVDVTKIPHRLAKLTLGALCLGTYTGFEMNWIGFAPTLYQKIGVKMGATESAHVAAILSTTYTVGRCINTGLSRVVYPDTTASIHFGIIICSMIALFAGQSSEITIYVGSAVLGYGFSAMNASIFGFSERHLKLTDRVCSIYAFSSGIFALIVPAILSQTFKNYPQILFIIEGVLLACCCTLFIVCKLWIVIDNRRSLT